MWNLGLSQTNKISGVFLPNQRHCQSHESSQMYPQYWAHVTSDNWLWSGTKRHKNNSWHETVGYKLHQPISKIETEINSSLVRLVENRDMEGKYCISIYRKTGKIKKHLRRATGQVMSSTKRVFKSYIILLNLNSTFFLYVTCYSNIRNLTFIFRFWTLHFLFHGN